MVRHFDAFLSQEHPLYWDVFLVCDNDLFLSVEDAPACARARVFVYLSVTSYFG